MSNDFPPLFSIRFAGETWDPGTPRDMELHGGESKFLGLPEEIFHFIDQTLLDVRPVPSVVSAEIKILGSIPGSREFDSHLASGGIARTFSPLSGKNCWIENLPIDENILLPAVMNGECPKKARHRANSFAERFGLEKIPATTRSRTSPDVLAVCQWIRAFLFPAPRLYLMVDALRSARQPAIRVLGGICKERLAENAAFLWLTPRHKTEVDFETDLANILREP